MPEFDITAYRDMWLSLAAKLAVYRADNVARAIEAKDMTALAKNQGADHAFNVAEALMAEVERAAGVNPLGRPAFEDKEALDA